MDFKCDELILGKKDADSRALTLFLIEISDLPSNLVAVYTIILHLFFDLCVQNFL